MYSVGDNIYYNGIYVSSESTNKLTPKYKEGTIAQVIPSANNPYLVNYNGTAVGWTNDNCITGKKEPGTGSVVEKFLEGLELYGDGRYSYYNSATGTGIGCSDYFCLGLEYIGYLHEGEIRPWAGQSRLGILTDTTRFRKHNANEKPQDGWIQWYNGAHVSIYDSKKGTYPNGRWEAAPESTHGICDNGKTGVGYWHNHNYECAGKPLTCYYEIIE